MRRTALARAALTVGLVALLVCGCSGTNGTPQGAATTSRPTPQPTRAQSRSQSPTPQAPAEGPRSWQRNRACVDSHKFTGKAPAYEGDGPHTIVEQTFNGGYLAYVPDEIFVKGYFPREDDAVVNDVELPKSWDPGPSKDADPKGPPYAQLVLCHTATPDGGRVGTCRFDTLVGLRPDGRKTFPVVRATHHFAVYVARTGKLLISFDLDSTARTTAGTCPVHATVDEDTVIAQPPSKTALTGRLRSLHDGMARQPSGD
jgi:hypothetical protein